MSTRYFRAKGIRDRLQNQTWQENHNKIQKALQNPLSIKGLKISELKQIAQIKSSRIVREHLQIFMKDGQVKENENDRRFFWITEYEKFVVWESMMNNLVAKLEILKVKPKEFFAENAILWVPEKVGNCLRYSMLCLRIEEMPDGFSNYWNAYQKRNELVPK